MENTDFSYQQPIQSMYMSTIPNKPKRLQSAARDKLFLQDIEGTRCKFIQRPIKSRQNFNNRNDDIQKSKSKVLIPKQVNKQSYSMQVDDISGTRSKMNKFVSSRSTNPLNPVYQLPHVQYYPLQQPKFIRDNLQTYDIQGTRTKQTFAMRLQKQGKKLNSKQQVQKSIQLKNKNFHRTTQNNLILDVTDINLKKDKIIRNTNPLDPQYILPIGQDKKGYYVYGKIQKSKPVQPRHKFNNPDFSLETSDIQGARTKVNNFVIKPKQEIKQAKPQTLKRGISSNRKTNPLNPNYKYPGWSQSNHNNVVSSFNGASSSYQRPKTAHQRFDAFIK